MTICVARPETANSRNLLSRGSRHSVTVSRTFTNSASCTNVVKNSLTTTAAQNLKRGQGLHSVQGLFPAWIAASLVVNRTRLFCEIFSAALQSGRWKTFEFFEAT